MISRHSFCEKTEDLLLIDGNHLIHANYRRAGRQHPAPHANHSTGSPVRGSTPEANSESCYR
jgi:hypothetical protein